MSDVVCSCGHRGVMSMSARCPSCGAAPSDRVTPVRMRVLADLARLQPQDPPLYIEPGVRIWLASRGLIAATEPRVAPSDVYRARRPVRRHAPTGRGTAVLRAAGIGAAQAPPGIDAACVDERRVTAETLTDEEIFMKSVAAQEESDRLQESDPVRAGHGDGGDP